jgi:hypothetical protein
MFCILSHVVESNLNRVYFSDFEANFCSRKTIVTSVRLKYRIGCCEINTRDIENGGWRCGRGPVRTFVSARRSPTLLKKHALGCV